MRIEIKQPTAPNQARAVLVVEPGDRVALVDAAHVIVGRPQTVPESGVVEWDQIDKCGVFWWAVLDEDGKVHAAFDPETWSPGITYTLQTRHEETL